MIEYFRTEDGYVALTERVIPGDHGPFRVGRGPHWRHDNPPLESIQTFHYGLCQIARWEKVDREDVPDEWVEVLGYEEVAKPVLETPKKIPFWVYLVSLALALGWFAADVWRFFT